MSRNEIIERLRHHLDQIVPGEAADLPVDADLRDELELDSMDFLHVVRALHEELKVDIPEVDYGKLETLDAFATYLEAKL